MAPPLGVKAPRGPLATRQSASDRRIGSSIVISPATMVPVNVGRGPKMAWFTGASTGSNSTVNAKLSPADPPPAGHRGDARLLAAHGAARAPLGAYPPSP